MMRATLKYVGKNPGVQEELILDPVPGKNGIRVGRTNYVAPVLFGAENPPVSTGAEHGKGNPELVSADERTTMSRVHCCFTLDESGWTFTDQSTHGTAHGRTTITDPKPVFTEVSRETSEVLRPGDYITFGKQDKSIFQFQFLCPEPESVEGKSDDSSVEGKSDDSSTPVVMQQLLDSLVQITRLKEELQLKQVQNSMKERYIERVKGEREEERKLYVALGFKLGRVEEELNTERLVKQGAVDALSKCQQELVKANACLDAEREINNELRLAIIKLERVVKMGVEEKGEEYETPPRQNLTVHWEDEYKGSEPGGSETLQCSLDALAQPPSPAASSANRPERAKKRPKGSR